MANFLKRKVSMRLSEMKEGQSAPLFTSVGMESCDAEFWKWASSKAPKSVRIYRRNHEGNSDHLHQTAR